MSNPPAPSWLQRLFESEFFDLRLALSYLHRYPDTIGIQHYICSRLDDFDEAENEFYLPQICHLLVSNPSESVALEEWLLTKCQEDSGHFAILTLWFLQSHLSDLRRTPNSEASRLCQRVFHKCQATVFSDKPRSAQRETDYWSTRKEATAEPTRKSWKDILLNRRGKLRENVKPAVVGIGAVLAAGVCPAVVDNAGGMIISQGRRWKSIQREVDGLEPPLTPTSAGTGLRRSESMRDRRRHSADGARLVARIPTGSASPDELSRGGAFSFRRYVAKTTVNHRFSLSRGSLSASSDSLPARLSSSSNDASIDGLHEHQAHLRSSHYFHAELQFMMTLVEISDRLRTVPKDARQSTLIAELALLNHNLPANVCVPLWCRAIDHKHHRVARISPADAVVLNSADRVPFLIYMEVLEDKEQTGEDTRIVEHNAPPAEKRDDDVFVTPDSTDTESEQDVDPVAEPQGTLLSLSPRVKQDQEDVGSNESLDGSDGGRRESESMVDYHRRLMIRRKSAVSLKSQFLASSPDASQMGLPPDLPQDSRSSNAVEEFSERMRTAAVMLAQLYQQQQRELVTLQDVSTAPNLPHSPVVVGAGGLPAHMARLTVVPPLPADSSANQASPSVVNAPVVSKDRRNYQRLKNDFEQIRNRLIKEMVTLEDQRIKALAQQMKQNREDSIAVSTPDEVLPANEEELQKQCRERNKDDPSAAVFRETWDAKVERIRASSPFGKDPRWRLLSMIVKSGADLRQEQLALQLIKELERIWRQAGVPVWVCCFRILITSEQSGIVETIRDAISVHSVKKDGYAQNLNETGLPFTLYDYFVREFGHPGSTRFLQAQDNFMRSLAAYSVICYLLQIKDRHNGNILVDIQGHIIHIDFGFMLSNSPGSVGFELAPFKFPQEYVDILGGIGSDKFKEFRALCKEAFIALRKNAHEIVDLVKIMEHGSSLPCFTGQTQKPQNMPTSGPVGNGRAFLSVMGSELDMPTAAEQQDATSSPTSTTHAKQQQYPVASALKDRFHLPLTEPQVGELMDTLIDRSINSAYTRLYDSFQYYANGIL
ncbi:kinase-like domain-containing protein [Gaertneriomyces semiglobifer]|nr:kinase-like domain-containing protein [Gaertneriomyces semiglobifer]